MKMVASVAPAQRCEEVEKHSFSVYGFEPSEKQQQNKRSASAHLLSAALKPLQDLLNVHYLRGKVRGIIQNTTEGLVCNYSKSLRCSLMLQKKTRRIESGA